MLLQQKLKTLPHKPGIYQFYDENKNLLYVGKAIDLKNRVSSYFQKSSKLLPKTRLMVSQIENLETITVSSEMEALLLEAELIKTQNPKYNHLMKDDKSYLYIHFTKEIFPRLLAARRNQITEKTDSFGPFPSSQIVKKTLRALRKVFAYRTCSIHRFQRHQVCLYYHLHLCQGPCENKISEENYFQDLQKIKLFLQRKSQTLLKDLKKEMTDSSKAELFEKAAEIRSQIQGLQYLQTEFRAPDTYIESPNLLEDEREQILRNLQQILHLPQIPRRIECYDISNFQGKEAVGSMVVFTDAEPDHKEYRRFRIKFKDTPDDFAMLQEVMSRRFKHSDRELRNSNFWPFPDLIVIDGGQGQLTSVFEILKQFENPKIQNLPLISLAKKEEEIYYFKNKRELEIHKLKLSRKSKELHLLQYLRDEAHRFAINYHRKLRRKKANV